MHKPSDGFVHLCKFSRIRLRFLSSDHGRFLACQITTRLQCVNSHIHERTAARQLLVETPLFWITNFESKTRFDHLDRSELFIPCHLNTLEMVRFVLASIPNCELPVGCLTSGYHVTAVGSRIRHRLFAQNMLARFGRSNGVFGMHAVWQDNVNEIDGLIRRQLVEAVVVIDMAGANTVFFGPQFLFVRRSSHNRSQFTVC